MSEAKKEVLPCEWTLLRDVDAFFAAHRLTCAGDKAMELVVAEPDATVETPEGRLSFIRFHHREGERFFWSLVVRILIFEGEAACFYQSEDHGGVVIESIVEQEIILSFLVNGQPARVLACLRGWLCAVQLVLEHTQEELFPHDVFVDFGSILKQKRPNTVEDFQRACLVKSRLGKFLPK